MGTLSDILDFLLGTRKQKRLAAHPDYDWPAVDSGLLPHYVQVDPPQSPISFLALSEILREVQKQKQLAEAREKAEAEAREKAEAEAREKAEAEARARRTEDGSHAESSFQIDELPPKDSYDDGLTVSDIHRMCNPRAFTNRIRQGVRDVYGGNAVPFYKNAGLSRSAYSRLISSPHRHPSKDTALAMAASLRLDLPAAEDFLRLAGYALSPSYPADVVWRMCFERSIHNLIVIRSILARV